MENADQISFWNKSAERIFGYTFQEVKGKNLHEIIISERYREMAKQGLSEFQKTGKGSIINGVREIEALKKDGSEILIELSVSAFHLDGKWHVLALFGKLRKESKWIQFYMKLSRALFHQGKHSIPLHKQQSIMSGVETFGTI